MIAAEIMTYNTHGLPWSRNTANDIIGWLKTVKPTIVCLQEIFVDSTRSLYCEQLTRYGYAVATPNDTSVTWLSSGLLTAVLESEFRIVSSCFCPYMYYHNVESFANKGFFSLTLRDTLGSHITIINTHTQSNTIVSWWFGDDIITTIRKQQFAQILQFVKGSSYPVLITGDLNCEVSPHPYIRFLRVANCNQTKKHTFTETGEDLDHLAWIPLQYADPGCGYCDIERNGPLLESCKVIPVPWSDHEPVLWKVRIPKPKQRIKE